MKKKLFTFLMTLILLTGSGTWAQAQTKGTHTFRLGDNQFWLDDKPFQIRFTRHVSRQNTGNNGYK